MKYCLLLPAAVCLLVFSGCARRGVHTIDSGFYSSDGSHVQAARPDTVTLEQELAGHLAMPDSVQVEIRARAESQLTDWRNFEQEVKDSHDYLYRWWFQDGNVHKRVYRGVGLGNSLVDLKKATEIDPSFVEAWLARGRLTCEAGDARDGLEYLDAALLAVTGCRESGRPVEQDMEMEIHRQRAWALRDLARWDEGLAEVREGLEIRHGDRELTLIKGLLLAGAGRYSEAVSLAVRMPPVRYRKYGLLNLGLEFGESAYANLWIKSQALLAIGDYQTARDILGDMSLYPYRQDLPFSSRFWQDTGLVAELAGDPDAPVYYAIGYITRKYDRYYPAGAYNMGPLVLDVPNGRMPCYTSFGNRFQVAGSCWSYIAVQMNQMFRGIFQDQKTQAAGRALQALDILERRNIRPDICRALRGRIFYAGDDFQKAFVDLKAAREEFRTRGEVDAGTSLLLGMIELQNGRYQPSARYLEESVEKDPTSAVGWRSLGVVYANLGLSDRALAAMDSALDLQPRSVSGLYNRGLFHYQSGDYRTAAADLDRALRLDPDNREVQRLLKMSGRGFLAQGGDPADLPGSARDYEYASGDQGPQVRTEVDPDLLLTQLEAEIDGFFTVPDSLVSRIREGDDIIADLEAGYRREGDPRTRKMLALAHIDRKEFQQAQTLLAPGWGTDLDPDEEIMLLYVDRMLGEQERARLLARQLVSGDVGTDNPYIWALTALTIQDDPRAVDESLVNRAFLGRQIDNQAKNYSTSERLTGAFYARMGFANVRASYAIPGVVLPIEDPWTRSVQRSLATDKGQAESAVH